MKCDCDNHEIIHYCVCCGKGACVECIEQEWVQNWKDTGWLVCDDCKHMTVEEMMEAFKVAANEDL